MPKENPLVKIFHLNLDEEKIRLERLIALKKKEASFLENDFFIKISPRHLSPTRGEINDLKDKYIKEYEHSIDRCIYEMGKRGAEVVNMARSIFYLKKRGVYKNIKSFIEDSFLLSFNSRLKELKDTFSVKLNRIENDLLIMNQKTESLRNKINEMELISNRLQLKIMEYPLFIDRSPRNIESLRDNIIVEYNHEFYHIRSLLREDFIKIGEEFLHQFPSFKLVRGMPIRLLESNLDRYFILLSEYLEIARILEMRKASFFEKIQKLAHDLSYHKKDKKGEQKKVDHSKYSYKKAFILNYQDKVKKNIIKP